MLSNTAATACIHPLTFVIRIKSVRLYRIVKVNLVSLGKQLFSDLLHANCYPTDLLTDIISSFDSLCTILVHYSLISYTVDS